MAKKVAKKKVMRKTAPAGAGHADPSKMIDQRIAELGDWRGSTLAWVRHVIRRVDPGITEAWKWRGTPVWEQSGIVCTGETYKHVVKLTFAKGARLNDPKKLFNASLEGNVRRAIDIQEGEKLDEAAFKKLVAEAIALNTATKAKQTPKVKPAKAKPAPKAKPVSKAKSKRA